MGTIAIYDVIGIQDFIFASNRLKENIGASIIIQMTFEEYLFEAIKENCDNNSYRIDWKQYSNFKMLSDPQIQAEVMYSGGGNALVAYQNYNIAINVTKSLSHKILKKSGGMLKFAVSYQNETNFKNYAEDKNKLIENLKIAKYQMVYSNPLLGIGITREGVTDGLPATEVKTYEKQSTREFISKSADLKRKIWEKRDKYFEHLLPSEDYAFPPEFNELGQKEGESYIAVVHIDGNNMGKVLDNLIDDQSYDYHQSIKIVRNFSSEVDKRYKNIMNIVIQRLADGIKDKPFCEKFNPTVKEGILPIRPIILNGDDVTFVCSGKIGISLAENFLNELHKQSEISVAEQSVKLSACAGVAIVKSHFPFYRAYQLAEELCKSSKAKGKTLAKINGVDEVANWLDFHIVQSGITTDLSGIRDKFYQVPGMESPYELQFEEKGQKTRICYKQFNLLWRPWCVAGNCDKNYDWNEFKKIYHEFTKNKKNKEDDVLWKRSRLKRLRAEMIKSAGDVENLYQEYQSRGFYLPEFFGDYEIYKRGNDQSELQQTPYFDALELLDFYIQIPD